MYSDWKKGTGHSPSCFETERGRVTGIEGREGIEGRRPRDRKGGKKGGGRTNRGRRRKIQTIPNLSAVHTI